MPFLVLVHAFLCLGMTDLSSILPALAFSLDMFDKTNQSYGVNEVLLASVVGAVVFSLFAAQPLVIVGVTGESIESSRSCNRDLCSHIRSDYGLQLYCLRYYGASWYQLSCFYVLDWNVRHFLPFRGSH